MMPHQQGAIGFVRDVLTDYGRNNGSLAAAAVAFNTTLSMIPLALLLVTVAAWFYSARTVESWLTLLSSSFGAGVGNAIRGQIISVVSHRGLLTGIALAGGVWTGTQLLVTIETALNQILDMQDHRPIWVRYGLAVGLFILTAVLFLTAVAVVYGARALATIISSSSGGGATFLGVLAEIVGFIIQALLAAAAFFIVYRYLPARQLSFRQLWLEALVAGVAWTVALQLFSWYTWYFGHYNVVYGSLGGLILLMLWFNYSAQIMLLGMEAAYVACLRKAGRD